MDILAMCLGGFLLFSLNAVFGIFAKELVMLEVNYKNYPKIVKYKKFLFLLLIPPIGIIAIFVAIVFSMIIMFIDDLSD